MFIFKQKSACSIYYISLATNIQEHCNSDYVSSFVDKNLCYSDETVLSHLPPVAVSPYRFNHFCCWQAFQRLFKCIQVHFLWLWQEKGCPPYRTKHFILSLIDFQVALETSILIPAIWVYKYSLWFQAFLSDLIPSYIFYYGNPIFQGFKHLHFAIVGLVL